MHKWKRQVVSRSCASQPGSERSQAYLITLRVHVAESVLDFFNISLVIECKREEGTYFITDVNTAVSLS